MKSIRSDGYNDATIEISAVLCDGQRAVQIDLGVAKVVMSPEKAARLFAAGVRLAGGSDEMNLVVPRKVRVK